MRTAVQIRAPRNAIRARLLWGEPTSTVRGQRGLVALFCEGEIVAYVVTLARRTHLFVFRTLAVDDRFAAKVPGVAPHVRLLVDLSTAGRVRLVQQLFAYLVKTGRNPSALPDEFYFRLSAALGGQLPKHKVLQSLLQPNEGSSPWM